MYRGFNLELSEESYEDYYAQGYLTSRAFTTKIRKELDDFLSPEGVIDGSKMEENWFPQIEADIFLSHSHEDEPLAVALAGFLHSKLGLKTFIDSSIWGYSNDLLKKIDEAYCKNTNGETYSYEKRNYSTAHVHMMLATALSKMIDKTECLIFLNTPDSVTSRSIIREETNSPWIYSEISVSNFIRKKIPSRFNSLLTKALNERGAVENLQKSELEIAYKLSLNHLSKLSKGNLDKCAELHSFLHKTHKYALDTLYDLVPIKIVQQ